MTLTIKTAQELMRDNMLVKHYAGSHAYGTNIASSDVDFRGIFLADPINIRTPFFPIKEVDDTTEEDTKFYELFQFMKLTLDCNPNVVETLWVAEQDVVHSTPAYQMLREAAPKLLSSKIAFTTSGYALSQLKRIKGHNKWINNPQPERQPQQVDFVSLVHNFTGEKMFKVNLRDYHFGHRLVPFSGDTFGVYAQPGKSPFNIETGALNDDFEGDSHTAGTPLFIVKFNRAVYASAKENWEHYWEWKKNRNKSRSVLEEQFGYDTKHAMHLVRLLRMGAEALETGVLNVRRPDAAELLTIRNGAWTYEQVVEYAEMMDNHVRTVLYPKTSLPKRPDIKLAAQLVMDVQDAMWTT
jgi:predicted nucleotidyltransferase